MITYTMSGICGVIAGKGPANGEDDLNSMMPALSKRGPDYRMEKMQGRVSFGYAGARGVGPAGSEKLLREDKEGKLLIAFDGTIYNNVELQQQLEEKGYQCDPANDGQLLLMAYRCWGDRFVEKLNGDFAFALYDRSRECCFLGRDPLGLKPLYYSEKDGAVLFASNTRALMRTGCSGELDRAALHYYLTLHAVVPAPRTVYASIKKVEPGTVMILDQEGRKKSHPYWKLAMSPREDLSEEEWCEIILSTMRRCVKRRMKGELPVGALLSGGLDSSLIVALMAELEPSVLRTYSIGFASSGGEEGNEFHYSDLIAGKYGTDHTKIYAGSDDLLPSVLESLRAMAEPMVSHDAVGFYLLAGEVARETKAVQCGQGADEIFAGYHWYARIMGEEKATKAGRQKAEELYRASFFDRSHRETLETLSEEYRPDRDFAGDFVQERFSLPESGRSGVEKALHLDTTVMLVEDPAKRVDNMTAARGLEARVPFLDQEMLDLAASIPPSLKVCDGGKYILKKAAERVIPREVIYRPKGYFPVPALKYMEDEFKDFAREILFSEQAKKRNLFNRRYLDKLFKQPEEQITPLRGNKIWQAAVLEFWLQEMEREV
ncbi:MAG: N-acetylglutaminylglutamine amidotransferase [Bacillota bacterium]|nr:N-acetylglutaminylglutamine amidotransferase [Bacillota bacterium]